MELLNRKSFECQRCKYKWFSRLINKKPGTCPKCRSPYWSLQKRLNRNDEKHLIKKSKFILNKLIDL